MFCQKCGAKNPDTAKFCGSCGNSFQKIQPKEAEKKETAYTDPYRTSLASDTDYGYREPRQEEPVYNNWDPERTLLHSDEEMWREDEQDDFDDIYESFENRSSKSGSGGGMPKWLIPALLAAVLILAIAAFVILKGGTSDDDKDDKQNPETEDVAEDEDEEEPDEEAKKEDSHEEEDKKDDAADHEDEEAEPEDEPVPEVVVEEEEGPADMQLINRNSIDTGKLHKIKVTDAEATSTLVQDSGKYDNSPIMAADGDHNTSWQEQSPGDGTGEVLKFHFDQEQQVKYICFKLGNWRDNEKDYAGNFYTENNRPKDISIWLGNVQYDVSFPDGRTEFCVELSHPMPAEESTLQINSVYLGTLYNDCVIAEIEYYSE